MSKASSCSVLLVSFAALLVGCSGGMTSPNQPVSPNMVQASLTIHDNPPTRSEEHTSELQSRLHLVCRLLLEKKKKHTSKQCAASYSNIIVTERNTAL